MAARRARRGARPGKAAGAPQQFELFPEAAEAAAEGRGLSVDLDGFEGPLHVLLALARAEKVDLREISITALADQYLAFVEAARAERLELAADYLVMAAWLADLKSRLLLPRVGDGADEEETPAEELARRLAFRLRRLEAMRAAGARLMERDLDGRDVLPRGAPEGPIADAPKWEADLYDLLKAYGARRSAGATRRLRLEPPLIYTIEQARARIEALIAAHPGWRRLDAFAPDADAFATGRTPPRASRMASLFCASLELAKETRAELRQDSLFGSIYLRARQEKESAAP